MAQQPLVGQGLLIIGASRTHSDIPTLVGLDKRSAQRRDLYQTTDNTHKRRTSISQGAILTHYPSKRVVADQRFRLRRHWDRQRWRHAESKHVLHITASAKSCHVWANCKYPPPSPRLLVVRWRSLIKRTSLEREGKPNIVSAAVR
jgi:hypothetical protein